MPADPIGEDNPIEAILLTAFPNPERVGCPSAEVMKAMANQQIGRDDAVWQHIWNCSPCFRDFKLLRDARVARVEREYERKRTRRNLLKGSAAVALSSAIAFFAASELRSRARHQVASVSIDLANAGVQRGEPAPVARLPRRLDEIRVALPASDPAGAYIVAILKSQSVNTAVALASATAQSEGGRAILRVTLDLSETPPGQYFLGTRREVDGKQGIPSYYPVLVSD